MKLNDEIEFLNKMILRMSDQVLTNLDEAFDAYLNYDPAKEYFEVNDELVNAQERAIEEECLNIMLRERPYAKDLRRVSGILKLVSDIERLGDHAKDVMHFALKLKNVERHHIKEINQMVQNAMQMVRDSIKSFITSDLELAESVIKRDDLIDTEYDELIEKIIKLRDKDGVSNAFAIYTTLVVKYIERIADHATNVGEWVQYILSGYHKDRKIF